MAENLNEYSSSVFTREDISALPVPEIKFESPGVDGIPPKLILKIVEQIIPLTTVFHLSLE